MKNKALLALTLLVPAPSIGAIFGMYLFPDTTLGQAVYFFSKIWLFTFPVIWFKFIEKQTLSFSPLKNGGLLIGFASGVIICLSIILTYIFAGDYFVDVEFFKTQLTEVGLGNKTIFLLAAAYWTLVNSVLEEYVWRWFIVKQCEQLVSYLKAVFLSSFFFTIHHIIALNVYFPIQAVLLCSLGVFLGGAIWSWIYLKYRSIWPAYLSHALVDLCIFWIAWDILFN